MLELVRMVKNLLFLELSGLSKPQRRLLFREKRIVPCFLCKQYQFGVFEDICFCCHIQRHIIRCAMVFRYAFQKCKSLAIQQSNACKLVLLPLSLFLHSKKE